jgi:fused signal recognition particle receptor
MFGFLKEKIKKTIEAFSKKTEAPPKKEETTPKEEKKEAEQKGFIEKITSTKISEEKIGELFRELEPVLLENNVSVKAIDRLRNSLIKSLPGRTVKRGSLEKEIKTALENAVKEILSAEKPDIDKMMEEKKPLIICFFGINGSGKTTTIAKFAKMLLKKGKSTVFAAADTFRAAAIDQLKEHAEKLGIKVISNGYGSDPAAAAFDAVKHAKANNIDAVLIDTAGRLHSNSNLIEEMKKIIRVAKPDLKIFVGESITGNDCVEQAEKFNETAGIDCIILSKADIDEKGGAALSISQATGKPIIFIGTGQNYDDLKEFSTEEAVKNIFS